MSRTVSSRIPKDLHEELVERCNRVGCTIADFIQAAVEFAMYGSTEFDFGDEQDDTEERTDKESKEIPTANVKKISYDNGKTWIDLSKKDEIPKVTIYLDK